VTSRDLHFGRRVHCAAPKSSRISALRDETARSNRCPGSVVASPSTASGHGRRWLELATQLGHGGEELAFARLPMAGERPNLEEKNSKTAVIQELCRITPRVRCSLGQD